MRRYACTQTHMKFTNIKARLLGGQMDSWMDIKTHTHRQTDRQIDE